MIRYYDFVLQEGSLYSKELDNDARKALKMKPPFAGLHFNRYIRKDVLRIQKLLRKRPKSCTATAWLTNIAVKHFWLKTKKPLEEQFYHELYAPRRYPMASIIEHQALAWARYIIDYPTL